MKNTLKNVSFELLKLKVDEILEYGKLGNTQISYSDFYFWEKDETGGYYVQIYTDYEDNIDAQIISDTLRNNKEGSTRTKIQDLIQRLFVYDNIDADINLQNCVMAIIHEALKSLGIEIEDDEEIYNHEIFEYVNDQFYNTVDISKFMETMYEVDLTLDTGDGNYDYSLNSQIYPCYCGENEPITDVDHEASVNWLISSQGYNPLKIQKMYLKDEKGEDEFTRTLYDELSNLSSHMSGLTFLVNMTLSDIVDLIDAVNSSNNNNTSILIPKETVCGLVDFWSGAGSILEIKLEKDVEIPLQFLSGINAIQLDDAHSNYGVQEIYGVDGSLWTDYTLKLNEHSSSTEQM